MLRAWGLRAAAGAVALAVVLTVGAVRAQDVCVGDCDGNGTVSVDEIVKGVNIGFGALDASQCPAIDFSGPPVIASLVKAVNNLLNGCPSVPTTAGIVFNGEDNRMHAYLPAAGFPKQTVVPSSADAPGVGRDVNGQICFTRGPQGQVRFIAGEDTNQGANHEGAGWGVFELTGDTVGSFGFTELNHLQATYQPTPDGAENYGCGFLSDGRLVTTDVGNQASGAGNGQLIMWYPPLDGQGALYCKLDITITTAQQIVIDDQDRIYLSSARTSESGPAGVYRYTGPFPSAANREGGCGRVDPLGAPMVDEGLVTKELFIPADSNVSTPGGLVQLPNGGFYVASVLSGVIAEYDSNGHFVRRVLQPPQPGPPPLPTGHPLGIGLASDGTLYYADIGLVVGPGGIGPGNHTGTVRRLRFVDGQPQPPEIMDTNLDFPDGIGIFPPPDNP